MRAVCVTYEYYWLGVARHWQLHCIRASGDSAVECVLSPIMSTWRKNPMKVDPLSKDSMEAQPLKNGMIVRASMARVTLT